MNLHCEEVNLIQTPTFITYMCFSNADGGWQGIKYRYIQWLKYECQLAFNRSRGSIDNYEYVKEHVEELNRHNVLTFSIV